MRTQVQFLPIAACFALVGSLPAATLFSDNFDGGSGNLDGTTPDVTTGGAAWVAAPVFNQDGSIGQGPGSATLSFTPADGLIYTLDASFTGVSGDGDWFGLGFANDQSALSSTNTRFITGTVVGTAWMLLKGDASTSQNSAFLGTGALGSGNNGLTSNVAWSTFTNLNPGGDMDMRIVLDTTGGAGNWTATWYAKRPTVGSYTEIRPTSAMLTESFDSVGLALSNPGVFGTIESFSLTSEVPEPGATMLLGLGGLALLRRRRK